MAKKKTKKMDAHEEAITKARENYNTAEQKKADQIAREKKIDAALAKLEAQEQTLEAFRTSFANIDTKFKNLIERNRLR